MNPSPAFFDVKKLRAFNGEYIRALAAREFAAACQPWLEPPAAPWPADRFDPAVFAALAPAGPDPGRPAGRDHRHGGLRVPRRAGHRRGVLGQGHEGAGRADPGRRPDGLQLDALAGGRAARARLEQIGISYGLSLGKAQAPVRVAVTGRTVGLPLFESLEVLGRERTLLRIQAARERLAGLT